MPWIFKVHGPRSIVQGNALMSYRMLLYVALASITFFGGHVGALQAADNVFRNPCDRGPVPQWELINSTRAEFVVFLQRVRPAMPLAVAEYIASEVCDDISILGDDEALTRRTNLLIQQAGY